MPASKSVAYPTRTKIVIVVALAAAIGGFVLAGFSADTGPRDGAVLSGDAGSATTGSGDDTGDGDPPVTEDTISLGVEVLTPPRGAPVVLAQETVTIDLASGWTGELAIGAKGSTPTPIPDDELDVNSLDQLSFTPDEGKALERLPSGETCVHADIWDQVRGRANTERIETWCFDVT